MADDQVILTHYGVATQFPTQWPTEKDDSEGSEAEGDKQEKPRRPDINNRVQNRRSKSRYSILERAGTQRRSVVPGAERTKDGVENLVQKDEADPLGAPDSVVRALRQKAIRVEDDQQLKNRFLLSSTTFTPALYLSQVHSDTSTQALLHGLDYLTRSIDKKSASLKVLVESNFERFVKAKSTIDNVYTQMRKEGIEDEPEVEKPRVHSRHSSKTSTHFRSASGQGAPNRGLNKPLPTNRKKHALTKESEYGILGIKAPLIEVNVKAEEVWGPALGGREREENLRSLVKSFEGCQSICAAEAAVSDCIKRKDYENLIQEFIKARQYADDARKIARTSLQNNIQLTESQVNQIVITGRMWQDVEVQLESFKREIWRKLTSVQANMAMSTDRNYQDDHMALISVLLELGVEDNPIWVWLLSRYDYLKNKINQTSDRSRMEIEVLRRQLANGDPPTSHAVALHLRTSIRTDAEQRIKSMDTPPILELWELIVASLNSLLSMHGGILGEVVDFWNKTQSFIDGKAQKTLPIGVDGNSMKHHRLSTDGVRDLQNGAAELVELLREHVCSFFADPPIEDISMIFSPAPTNAPNTPKSAPLSPYPLSANRLRFNLTSPPPPSPKRGEPWEDFAFWPPYANSVSGVHYLNVALTLLGTAAGEMAAMRPMATERSGVEKLKLVVSGARERCARALCAAWNRDAELCKVLEDWTREPERRDLTKMPARFASFEATVLCGMQKVVYLSEAGAKSKSSDVIALPPTKLLQMIRSQFVTSLYKALSGMVENAEKPVNATADAWAIDQGSMDNTIGGTGSTGDDRDKIDTSNRVRPILQIFSMDKYSLQKKLGPPHAPHALEPQKAPKRNRAPTNLPIRNQFLRQTKRRKQNHPRRPKPNRRPPLPILYAPHRRLPRLNHKSRNLLPDMGPAHNPPHRSKTLHLPSPPRARLRPHRSKHDSPTPNDPYPIPPPRTNVHLPPRRLPLPPHPLHPPRPHASNPRHRIRSPDPIPIYHRARLPNPKSDLSRTRSAHR